MHQQTIQAYNQLAQDYDKHTIDFWEKFPNNFMDAFTKLATNPVLDEGSGPGRDGLLLQKAGLNILCLDASRSMVSMSTSRGLPSVIGNLLSLPFPDNSYGGVWAYTSLIHIPRQDISKALKETRRVLKPDAPFAIGLIEGTGENIENQFKDLQGKYPRLFTYYTQEEIEILLKNSGYKNIKFIGEIKTPKRTYLHILCQKE